MSSKKTISSLATSDKRVEKRHMKLNHQFLVARVHCSIVQSGLVLGGDDCDIVTSLATFFWSSTLISYQQNKESIQPWSKSSVFACDEWSALPDSHVCQCGSYSLTATRHGPTSCNGIRKLVFLSLKPSEEGHWMLSRSHWVARNVENYLFYFLIEFRLPRIYGDYTVTLPYQLNTDFQLILLKRNSIMREFMAFVDSWKWV